eukprot:36979-Eustigmatos_ZCMA.PRE.1
MATMSKKGGEGTGEVTMEGLEQLLKSNGITEEERAIFETMFTVSPFNNAHRLCVNIRLSPCCAS